MKALLVIDLQNDFCSGGALEVPDGDKVVPIANRLLTGKSFDISVLTQDWHCPGHGSFASSHEGVKPFESGILDDVIQTWWPDHCVWGTKGAELHKNLFPGRAALILRKGMNKLIDSYSAFNDNKGYTTGLNGLFEKIGVTDVFIMGLATDYCVKYTALSSVRYGFNTYLIEDGCRAVDLKGGKKAIEEMKIAGAHIVQSKDYDKT